MALLQGDPLPNVSTTQTQTTTAPDWYTNYLSGLAKAGTQGAQSAQFVGAQPLQQQAYSLAQGNVGNYQPVLDMGVNYLGQVGNYNAATAGEGAFEAAMAQNSVGAASPYLQQGAGKQILGAAQPYLTNAANPTYNQMGQYMSPYIGSVVNAIGQLGEQNILQNVAPQTTAGVVGAGQFGSQRGAQALGQTLNNAAQAITAQQANALQTGYTQAQQAAQAQNALNAQLGATAGALTGQEAVNQLNAGQTFGNLTNQLQANQTNIGQARANAASMQMQNLINAALAGGQLATTTQNLGLGDVNALSTLGGQQQQIAQNQQLFPLQLAAQQSNILRGYTIPTSVLGSYSGPIPGAYGTSPLGAGLGTASLIGALTQKGSSGTSPLDNIMSLFGPSAATKAGQEASKIYGAGNVYGPGGGGVVPTYDPTTLGPDTGPF
jgi:hypothetical protein